MIRHLVLFRLADGSAAERAEQTAGMRDRLEALPALLSGVLSLRVGPDVVGGAEHWDVALCADFTDRDALQRYQVHPEHRAAVEWMASFVAARSIVDLELTDPGQDQPR
ncbi:MAG TPA: Dabb family protein [Amnibacterium sp.]|jgi:hypothetical protein|uniref:Dabb family protein n=1 Tax=Amnibacterium sp. TaxID=1872496 RepID=UPI002F9299A3